MDGVVVNLHKLFGDNQGADILKKSVGQTISALYMRDSKGAADALVFEFESGFKMGLTDAGQSCCEQRYMMTDDKLDDFIGAEFAGAEIRDVKESKEEDWEVHEQQFLIISTSKGQFTMVMHNIHNGYYGGFWITAIEL